MKKVISCISQHGDLAEDHRGASMMHELQQSMFKYKHGRGCYALNTGFSVRHRRRREKKQHTL